MPPVTKKVILAFTYTDVDDRTHKAGSTLTLPRHEANRLIVGGLARLPEDEQAKAAKPDKPASAAEILAAVGDDVALAQLYLDAEKAAGRPRKGLVKKLESIGNTQQPGDSGEPKEN